VAGLLERKRREKRSPLRGATKPIRQMGLMERHMSCRQKRVTRGGDEMDSVGGSASGAVSESLKLIAVVRVNWADCEQCLRLC
jgi:hypothetical protein